MLIAKKCPMMAHSTARSPLRLVCATKFPLTWRLDDHKNLIVGKYLL